MYKFLINNKFKQLYNDKYNNKNDNVIKDIKIYNIYCKKKKRIC